MKQKRIPIALVVVAIIGVCALITAFNNYRSKTVSKEIDASFLRHNWGINSYDVEKVLYVKKFTENESVAFAVSKTSDGVPYVWVLWDGWSRYAEANYIGFYEMEKIDDPYSFSLTEDTEFGQPYFCLFLNPTEDTLVVDGKEHEVFQFDCTVDGVDYHLGFYCGLLEEHEH